MYFSLKSSQKAAQNVPKYGFIAVQIAKKSTKFKEKLKMTSIGQQKFTKYCFVALIILLGIILTPNGSYLNTVFMCLPSYFAVTFGAYAFLKIGFKLANTESHDSEADGVKKDVERAKKFLAGKLD